MPLENLQGNSPIILALPYTGTNMQRQLVERLLDEDQFYTAPDRCLDRLTAGLFDELNLIRANFHRFQSDADFPDTHDNQKVVRGMIGVVPLLDRFGQLIWSEPPSKKEAATWRATCYVPYHAVLGAQVARVRARHGHAIVVTCRARPLSLDREGSAEAADIQVSTYMGASCAIGLSAKLCTLLKSDSTYVTTLNGRMNTGWSTRLYGRPATGVHALDLEINERAYLGTGDMLGLFDEDKAAPLRALLGEALRFLANWRPN